MKIPVVLSVVHVAIDADGVMAVEVDGVPRDPEQSRTRSDLRAVIDEITSDLGVPVRVEVRETDGSTYADIATPPEFPGPATTAPSPTPPTPALVGAGFQPGEEVALAYLVVRQTADAAGNASFNLPPALLAATRGGLVLLGMTSRNSHPIRGAGMNPAARSANDELVNLALIGLLTAFALALVLRSAATVAAIATGTPTPEGGVASGLRVLTDPGRPARAFGAPGLSAIAYWSAVTLLLGVLAALAWASWRLVARLRHRTARDPHGIQGTASARDIDATASKKALVRRAATLRPSVQHPRASDVGYLIGRSCGREIWASVEDSILVIGPPRSGKGLHLVINAILDAAGAVVTTSTRPDNIAATIDARRERGPVAVFDPQDLTAGLPAVGDNGVRWSPIRGCEQPLTAMIRASGLASATGLSSGGTESGGFWEGKARSALQALLHAAALERLPTRALFEWSLSVSAATDAVGILASDPHAAAGWSDSLEGMISSDSRTRDSIWMAVAQALSCLADPAVLDAVSPEPGEGFEPRDFLTRSGTLYLLATGAGAGASWPLVAAFVEDLTEVARHLAAASPGARLDPPVLMALDEIGNLAPLPSLPVLMAEGGGTGITTMPVLQSLAQARTKWGDHAASTIWDASIVKVVLGGASASKDLQELSVIIGQRDERTDTVSIGDYGQRSLQRSTRRVAVMPPERIRTLPFGRGLVLLRSAPPIVASLRPWTNR